MKSDLSGRPLTGSYSFQRLRDRALNRCPTKVFDKKIAFIQQMILTDLRVAALKEVLVEDAAECRCGKRLSCLVEILAMRLESFGESVSEPNESFGVDTGQHLVDIT